MVFLQALDGFVIVLTQDCELFYASETVQDYLGLSQVSSIWKDALIIRSEYLKTAHQNYLFMLILLPFIFKSKLLGFKSFHLKSLKIFIGFDISCCWTDCVKSFF